MGFKTKATHAGGERKNAYYDAAMSFCTENRVSTSHLSNDPDDIIKAVDVDPYAVLPSPEVYARGLQRLVEVTVDILLEYMPYLSKLTAPVRRHAHQKEMDSRSIIVSITLIL